MNISNPLKVLIVSSRGLPQDKIKQLQAAIPQANLIQADDHADSIFSKIEGVNALIGCPRSIFSNALLEKAGQGLKWVHVSGAGCEEFLIPRLVESPVTLTNGKIIQGPSVADHALALLLSLTRRIHSSLRDRPIELRAKVALIVGLGGIGLLVAERVKAFGMKVIGIDPKYIAMLQMFERVYAPQRLLEVLPQADVVIVSAPCTQTTRKMFDHKAFSAMKKTAYLINVSRGSLIDTEALTHALREGDIFAAGLDVTDPEPLAVDHPLRKLKNVVLTSHIAGPSDHNRQRSFELIRDNIERFVNHLPLVNVVDKKVGY